MRNAIKMVGLLSALTLSACGGDKGEDLGRFVGTWQATSGTGTVVCPGYAPLTGAVDGNIVWSTGVGSDLVATDASGCAIIVDVQGSTASGVPSKGCTMPDGAGGVQTITVTAYTFVLSPDGQTATENESGNINDVLDGATLLCTFNSTASYRKLSN